MNGKPSRPEQVTVDYVAGSGSNDSRVVSAVQQFLAALQAGKAPDRKAFAATYPEIASELERCLEGLELVHQAAAEMRSSSSAEASLGSATPHQLGDYRLVREVGRGGMGVVYEALQISLNRRVAVKVLPFAAAIDRTHVQRFRNEAQAAAQLHHANIVPVYAVGDERGIHYYAMQFIDGQPLSDVIARLRRSSAGSHETTDFSLYTNAAVAPGEAPRSGAQATTSGAVAAADTTSMSTTGSLRPGMPKHDYFRSAAELIRQAAEALDYAHQFGVVHRDIKPANLLVDRYGALWIADFGLAHIQADVSLTRTGDVLGTLAYMSPEQASGNRLALDHRTDIYSLGATLFELLALEPVFPESDRHRLLQRIIEEEPRPLRRVNPDAPVELEIIVGKAIAKEPQQRYATAREFADDLRRWIHDEPILARPPTWTERTRKWSRRHRSLVRTAGAFALLGVLGLLVSTILIAAEQAKTQAAYQAELEQRLAADESFRQARQAVDAFVQLGEEELANNPLQRALRRRFLETALEYYHAFIQQRRDDPRMQAELAASSARVEQLIGELTVLEGYAPLMFLTDRRVGKELGLSASQGDEIARRMSQLARERREATAGKNGSSQAARQHQLAATLRTQQEEIAAILTQAQMTRLKQIAWQQQGPLAFENAEVAEALRLTDAQRSRIAELIDEERPENRAGPGRKPEPRALPPEDDRLADLRPPPRERRRPPLDEDDPLGFGPLGPPPGHRGPPDRDGPPPRRGPEGRGGRGGEFGGRPRDFGPPEPPPFDDLLPPPDDLPEGPPPRRGVAEREPKGASSLFAARQNATARIVATLSDEQQRAWARLIGEPFDVDLQMRPEDWSLR